VHAGHLRFAAKSVFALVQAIKDAKVNPASQVYLFHLAFSGCGLFCSASFLMKTPSCGLHARGARDAPQLTPAANPHTGLKICTTNRSIDCSKHASDVIDCDHSSLSRVYFNGSDMTNMDPSVATMLSNVVESLEEAGAPLKHVYFTEGVKQYGKMTLTLIKMYTLSRNLFRSWRCWTQQWRLRWQLRGAFRSCATGPQCSQTPASENARRLGLGLQPGPRASAISEMNFSYCSARRCALGRDQDALRRERPAPPATQVSHARWTIIYSPIHPAVMS